MVKRILHLIPTLSSGGAERQLVNNICNASRDEFLHCVCTFGDSEFFAPIIRKAGHQVQELKITAKYPWLQGAKKFRSVVRQFQPDLIHTWLYDASIAGRIANLFQKKIPLVTSLQAPNYEPDAIRAANWSPRKMEGLRQIDKMTTRFVKTYFVACSEYVKDSYQQRFSLKESQIEVIYNSVDPELLAADPGARERVRRELAFPADAFVFIAVGRLDPQKNYPLLLRAFPQVLAVAPEARLLIVGTGGLETELKNLAESLGIANRVCFAGRRADAGACFEAADVFVFPTLFEGFGLVLTEAMFKKLPCVASRLAVLQEIITEGENGLMFAPNQADDLAKSMTRLFQDSTLRGRLGESGKQEAERRFHVSVTTREWENLYMRLISQSMND